MSVRELEIGEVGVLRRGSSLIEMYRDGRGRVVHRWAACAQADGGKSWNGGESRWTCPCFEA
jgi:hypothetical protein